MKLLSEEIMIPVGIGAFGESLIYEKAYCLSDGTILVKRKGFYYETTK